MNQRCKRIKEQMSTKQIDSILRRNAATKTLYQGIYPCDMLPRYALSANQRPSLIVVNEGSSLTAGTHWVLLFFPKSLTEPAYFFDSFGRTSHLADINNFIMRNSKWAGFHYNRSKLQDDESLSCGQFVVATAWLLARGIAPQNIGLFFSKPDNDCILRGMIKKIANSYLMRGLLLSAGTRPSNGNKRWRLWVVAVSSPAHPYAQGELFETRTEEQELLVTEINAHHAIHSLIVLGTGHCSTKISFIVLLHSFRSLLYRTSPESEQVESSGYDAAWAQL